MPLQFPTVANPGFPLEPAGPQHIVLQDLEPELPALTVKTFKDGGAVYGLQNTNPVYRWDLTYNGLFPDEAELLDDFRLQVEDQFLEFDFRHPRTGRLYHGVHIETFEYPAHEKFFMQSRHIVLIKRGPVVFDSLLLEDGISFLLTERGFHFLLEG